MIRDAAGQLTEEGQMLLDESHREHWCHEVRRLWKEYGLHGNPPDGYEDDADEGWDPHDWVVEAAEELRGDVPW